MKLCFKPWRKYTRTDFFQVTFEVKDQTMALDQPHKEHSRTLSQSSGFQGRVGKWYVTRGVSVLETKSLVSQNH